MSADNRMSYIMNVNGGNGVYPLLILKDGSMGERLATIRAVVRLFLVFLLMGLKVMLP